MKALILSGGTGSRLRPLTYTSAKQLIPIGNKPVLFYAIEAVRAVGITEIGIVVGDTRVEVKAAVGDGSQFGVKITYIEQDAPRGLAHAVAVSAEFLDDEPFVMYLGDNLIKGGITWFVQEFQEKRPNALILVSRVDEPQRFGVVELEGNRVVRLVEKPKVPRSDLALVGVYLFDHHILRAVREIIPSSRGELEITDAIQWLVDQGYTVEPHLVSGWWKDTGKPEDVIDANSLVLEDLETDIQGEVTPDSQLTGRVALGAGSRIINSTIRGPVIIGSGVLIKDAYVGPYTSISANVVLDSCEIENSIVLEGASITGVSRRIDESLIGRNVIIQEAEERPKVLKLVLGDNSRIIQSR